MKTIWKSLILLFMIVLSCKEKNLEEKYDGYQKYIDAFTYGNIKSTDKIRIAFSQDVMTDSQVETELTELLFEISPKLPGKQKWVSTSEIEFLPENPIPLGTSYKATFALAKVMDVPKKYASLDFIFEVPELYFDISTESLELDADKGSLYYTLDGSAKFSDLVSDEDAEKVLQVAFTGSSKPQIDWYHPENSSDPYSHNFIISNIGREKKDQELQVSWNGAPINIKGKNAKGQQDISVSAIGKFEVQSSRVNLEDDNYIEVEFSNNLDKKQDLRGIVMLDSISDSNLRFSKVKNILRIYSGNWPSEFITLNIEQSIRDDSGQKLAARYSARIDLVPLAPTLLLQGKGNILPDAKDITLPIKTRNLKSVVVEVVSIPQSNMLQFLQVNDYSSSKEMRRVGGVVWRKTVDLDWDASKFNQEIVSGLDLRPLSQAFSDSLVNMFQVRVYFTMFDVMYLGADPGKYGLEPIEEVRIEDGVAKIKSKPEQSYWNYYDEGYNNSYYRNRNDPTHWAYYGSQRNQYKKQNRNIVLSNIGLIAQKEESNKYQITTTNLLSGKAMPDVNLEIFSFAQKKLGEGKSSAQGIANISLPVGSTAFVIKASKGKDISYLRTSENAAINISSFDTSGIKDKSGMRGYIYGERDIWRPGDDIFISFVLNNRKDPLPSDYPVQLTFSNPSGQIIQKETQSHSIEGIYSFRLGTHPDAPTGKWTIRIKAGATVFTKNLSIETIIPNRLKVETNILGLKESNLITQGRQNAEVTAEWLHGAPADNLKAKVELELASYETSFSKYANFSFTDPTRDFATSKKELFEGNLNQEGNTRFYFSLEKQDNAPGLLNATLYNRVYEKGGAFSQTTNAYTYSPYPRYVGILPPKGDASRNMLLTDTTHKLQIVLIDEEEKPINSATVQAELLKMNWRWWWEKGAYTASESGSQSYNSVLEDTVEIRNGQGEWEFELKYPSWGRYLLRVRDPEGGHAAAKVVYIDWPGWAGRQTESETDGASVLVFGSGKKVYEMGEEVEIFFPDPGEGQIFVSLESKGTVLQSEWVASKKLNRNEQLRYTFKTSAEMMPNIYVHAMLLQPHSQQENDRPIRMYGVIPLRVEDSKTHLKPVIQTSKTFKPNSTAKIKVSEQNGTAMGYTLAIVDEGLLNLTSFPTPNPWDYFYQKEASLLRTWDIFRYVVSAYGAKLENLLAIGGGDRTKIKEVDKAKRFPPMVRYLGPFYLEKNASTSHEIDIPQYVGAVRVMVVASSTAGQYGSAEKEVKVAKPLMVLGTLPRSLHLNDKFNLPITVFALDKNIRNVNVSVKVTGPLQVEGDDTLSMKFDQIGDQIASIPMSVLDKTGIAQVEILARSGSKQAKDTMEIEITNPSRLVSDYYSRSIPPNQSWVVDKLDGGNFTELTGLFLEASLIEPVNLSGRLAALIGYPHGCIEQTVSKGFPQLYLGKLYDLEDKDKEAIQKNIKAAIERLKSFQVPSGGFSYWPSGSSADPWGSTYAGHFLLEAKNAGYVVPSLLLNNWLEYQKTQSKQWSETTHGNITLQAYRLLTLSMMGQSSLAAMNRIYDSKKLKGVSRWNLAAAYTLAGRKNEAQKLFSSKEAQQWDSYFSPGKTYGSSLRDQGMALYAAVASGQNKVGADLANLIRKELNSDNRYFSTQTTAWALMGLTRWYEAQAKGEGNLHYSVLQKKRKSQQEYRFETLFSRLELEPNIDESLEIKNLSDRKLYLSILTQGKPAPGRETAQSNQLKLSSRLQILNGDSSLSPVPTDENGNLRLEQGQDFVLRLQVENETGRKLDDLALSVPLASGWEFLGNFKKDGEKAANYDYRDVRDDVAYVYFKLNSEESTAFTFLIHASYAGEYYAPFYYIESMYRPEINALIPGSQVIISGSGG